MFFYYFNVKIGSVGFGSTCTNLIMSSCYLYLEAMERRTYVNKALINWSLL